MHKKIVLSFLVSLLFTGTHIQNVYADTLPLGSKIVDGFVKFVGQESVNEYVLVQPADMAQWNDCNGISDEYANSVRKEFYLLNDGPVCNFGSESHCAEYYNPVAIPKKYNSQITLVQEGDMSQATQEYLTDITTTTYTPFDIYTAPIYSVTCGSSAYKEAIPTDFIIPHEVSIISETSPTIRRDYVVEILGVDAKSRKLLMQLKNTFNRTEATKTDAVVFAKSLSTWNTLTIPHKSNKQEGMESLQQTPKPDLTSNDQKKETIVESSERDSDAIRRTQILDIYWLVATFLSITSISFFVGYKLGLRKKESTVEVTTNHAGSELKLP